MKLSICTDVMGDLPFTAMLDKCVELGVEGIEMTGGGWSKGPHFRAAPLLADKGRRKAALKEIEARGLGIAALNCSANPLDPGPMGARHRQEMEETVRLAGEIGVATIVTMSGLPAAAPGDTVPNSGRTAPSRSGRGWSGSPRRWGSSVTRSRTSAPCWSGTRRRSFA